MGIGADVRHASLRTSAGTLAGRTVPSPRTAAVMAATNVGLDWLEFSRSDDAQQLSACAWVRTRSGPELCESPSCIGQSSAQQALRASGVGNHPAQIATFPAIKARVRERADSCRTSLSTCLGCSTSAAVSNERVRRIGSAIWNHICVWWVETVNPPTHQCAAGVPGVPADLIDCGFTNPLAMRLNLSSVARSSSSVS